jgi:xanthine dehydrogenase accessory factor
MSTQRIIQAFEHWRDQQQQLVLVSVYATEGSTYSKPGHRILVTGHGQHQGMISGGCLEGDLAEQAKSVLRDGVCRTVTYDLRDDADEIWGLGIGCNGVMKVLLQPLDTHLDYEPFKTLVEFQQDAHRGISAMVIESPHDDLPVGSMLAGHAGNWQSWQIPDQHRRIIQEHCESMTGSARPELVAHGEAPESYSVLYAPLTPLPRLLILGGGPDALPLVTMANELGWLVTVVDHRPAAIKNTAFDSASKKLCIAPETLADTLTLSDFSAAVVMSHHLETDRKYLLQLAACSIEYVGVLGPAERRHRLIGNLEASNPAFAARLRGPVGLDIGADSPETIALSILAEIQQALARQT